MKHKETLPEQFHENPGKKYDPSAEDRKRIQKTGEHGPQSGTWQMEQQPVTGGTFQGNDEHDPDLVMDPVLTGSGHPAAGISHHLIKRKF